MTPDNNEELFSAQAVFQDLRLSSQLPGLPYPAANQSALAFPAVDGLEEYTASYIAKMIQEEELHLPRPDALDYQTEISHSQRRYLIDWLISVASKFNLHVETLPLAVNLVDRYLSHRVVPLDDFQLLGVTCLFIASKYNDLPCRVLTIRSALTLCCAMHTNTDIYEMEHRILEVMGYNLAYKSPSALIELVANAGSASRRNEPNAYLPGADTIYPCVFSDEALMGDLHEPAHCHGVNTGPLHALPPATTNGVAMQRYIEPPHRPTLPFPTLNSMLVQLAHHILKLSLLHSRFTGIQSSQMAVGAIVAADKILVGTGEIVPGTLLDADTISALLTVLSSPQSIWDIAHHLVDVVTHVHYESVSMLVLELLTHRAATRAARRHVHRSIASNLPTPPPERDLLIL
ncbi:hypothetical protein HDU93_008382 [Gonapodya sp. JEL0774]|nr:hypothetical protein HDU93_008382 [Gonapodya sp. JEL0774]